MNPRYGWIALLVFSGVIAAAAQAARPDLLVPAGTLLQCTMDEPDFSSATASLGDPFLCYPRAVQQFGQTVFPRGTYMVGHLESAKDPGRLLGKGYMKLALDRIGLPSTDVPLSAKVISVADYKVDKSGDILGKGHAERDILEWMLPPLWPWKVVMLPARGPRPELKGEVRITLRVMDDLTIPQIAAASLPASPAAPQRYSLPLPPPQSKPAPGWHFFGEPGVASPAPSAAPQLRDVSIETPTMPDTDNAAWPANVTLVVTTGGALLPFTTYQRSGSDLLYTLADNGGAGAIALNQIDWGASARLNAPRHVRLSLEQPSANFP